MLRANEIANNNNMLIDNTKSISKSESEESSGGCLKINMCFNKSSESEFNPNQSHDRIQEKYNYTPFESAYKLDNKVGSMKKYVEEEMMKFNSNYDVSTQKFVPRDAKSPILTKNISEQSGNFAFIFESIKEWTNSSKMESEIPIMALVYIERLMKKTGVLVNIHNWSRIVMVTLCIASKIWDDESLENEHFAQVFKNVSLKEISVLEKSFLNLIEYEVMITSKQFTKYAFILSTFCNGEVPDPSSPERQKSVKKMHFESERLQYKYRGRRNEA